MTFTILRSRLIWEKNRYTNNYRYLQSYQILKTGIKPTLYIEDILQKYWSLMQCNVILNMVLNSNKKRINKKKRGEVNILHRYHLAHTIRETRTCWGNCEFRIDSSTGSLADIKRNQWNFFISISYLLLLLGNNWHFKTMQS